MKLYLGEVEAFHRTNQVFLCVGEQSRTNKKDGTIILQTHDFDSQWVKNIVNCSDRDEKGINYLDAENQYYMQLYLMFSLRRRLYYADIKKLMDIGYVTENLLYHQNVQLYLWEELCNFMKTNGYCFKVIKSIPSLYEERPYIPLCEFHCSDFLCSAGIRMLFRIVKRLTIRYMLYFGVVLNGVIQKSSIEKKLMIKYADVQHISSKSQSGCLFFSADSISKDKLFIKMGTVRGADIENEYRVCKYLKKSTANEGLYLLPYMEESSSDKLVFPFVRGCSLKKVISERDLTTDEVKKLLSFLESVLTDLEKCKIVHRDIHFDNILCGLNHQTGEIDNFLLSDFGCAVIDHEKIWNDTLRQKRKNQYAGSIYRYARYSWDDAAAAVYAVLQNINADMIDPELKDRLLFHVGKNVCILK